MGNSFSEGDGGLLDLCANALIMRTIKPKHAQSLLTLSAQQLDRLHVEEIIKLFGTNVVNDTDI